MTEEICGTIWVCICCYAMSANGECCSNDDHGGDGSVPLSSIESPYHAAAGMGWEDHDSSCLTNKVHSLREEYPDMEWPDVPGDYECECETDTFSTSQCDGCGSWLHGERHAMTLFRTVEPVVKPDPLNTVPGVLRHLYLGQ